MSDVHDAVSDVHDEEPPIIGLDDIVALTRAPSPERTVPADAVSVTLTAKDSRGYTLSVRDHEVPRSAFRRALQELGLSIG